MSEQALRDGYALLSSMRFAIGLLLVVALAAMVGTLLPQNETKAVYVERLGAWGAELALALQLNAVYSAWWFVLILAFLVLSTSICVARNAPKYLREMRRYKEHVRLGHLRAMPLHMELPLQEEPQAGIARLQHDLQAQHWRVRVQQRGQGAAVDAVAPQAHAQADRGGTMLAARKGGSNKLGYIASHCAIVLICLGGLLDSGIWARVPVWLGWKTPLPAISAAQLADAQAGNTLSAATPAYRGSVIVSEGAQTGTAILPQSSGFLLQTLPFTLELLRFEVDYYSTGMPKLFASEVIVHDRATGESTEQRIAVNHPLRVHGVDIYQSSFADGGSMLQLLPQRLGRFDGQSAAPAQLQAKVRDTVVLPAALGLPGYELEVLDLRVLNVEDLTQTADSRLAVVADVRPAGLGSQWHNQWQDAQRIRRELDLRNVGPSVDYLLRDPAGQTQQFRNFMQPVDVGDGVPVYLLGMRGQQGQEFAYWRVPQDAQGSMQTFVEVLHAINEPARLQAAIDSYAAASAKAGTADVQQQTQQFAAHIMAIFLGQGAQTLAQTADALEPVPVGLAAVQAFIEQQFSAAQQSQASEAVTRILQGIVWALIEQQLALQGWPALDAGDASAQAFAQQTLVALDQAFYYPVPLTFILTGFEQVQASVFEVSKAPGRLLVYSGALALIVGVFAMLFIRERRLWIWLGHSGTEQAPQNVVLMALSSNRKTIDAEQEFHDLARTLFGVNQTGATHHAGDREQK
ncbi:cytochrome c biogenesis protein ResB [Lampropedia aestuarii]|uniref:Cytochrome c biogenesis protein ResB n=1 Tax=Lampropedia aestuarii TaxID=2562762 RepID=A0A4S5C027_9BURK|nr:cytochrome c biogenesis protein ResB [Lampropedia aestuarii]THJ35738.1 cytochrome c biogenesis protein ResB [Lampropedia aestuarii]